MFGLFKTKEKKQEDKQKYLEEELKEFTEKYKEYFNCYVFTGKDILIYKEPQILKDEVVLNVVRMNTPKGYVDSIPIGILELQYGDDFLKKHRVNFIILKDKMEKMGLSVNKVENK